MNKETILRLEEDQQKFNKNNWKHFSHNLGNAIRPKNNKGIILSMIGGIIFPPLFIAAAGLLGVKVVKATIFTCQSSYKSKQQAKLYSFNDNFSLSKTYPVDNKFSSVLLENYKNCDVKKDIQVLDAKFISRENNVFTTIEYDKQKDELKKFKVVGMKNGEWVCKEQKMKDYEINLAKSKLMELSVAENKTDKETIAIDNSLLNEIKNEQIKVQEEVDAKNLLINQNTNKQVTKQKVSNSSQVKN